MAKYTIELREIVENGRDIFPFAYDFYDENKRPKFEQDFIRHFYFREIGCETVDRFILNLQDKMQTVFPVYNAMLKAGQIEYNVLDNYYLSETTKRTIESKGNSSGVTSTVGQTFDDQQTDTTENRTGTGTGTQNETGTSESSQNSTSETVGTGKETKTETGTSETTTSESGTSETIKAETVNVTSNNSETSDGTNTKTGSGSTTTDETVNKKFLDTPQGLTDLTDSKYLTSLNQDETDGKTETENTETITDSQTKTVTGTSDTETNGTENSEHENSGTSLTESSSNGEVNTESNSKTTVSDSATGETSRNATDNTSYEQDSSGNVIFKAEQRTTNDNNTRLQNDNKSTEETEVIHKGNVGVDSDAVMIQKHLKLQQLIANTFKMFFDECEDLFMMVY